MKQFIMALSATETLDNDGVIARAIVGVTMTPQVSIYDMRNDEKDGKKGDGSKAQGVRLILTDEIPAPLKEIANYPMWVSFTPKDIPKTQGKSIAYTVASSDLEIGRMTQDKTVIFPKKTA